MVKQIKKSELTNLIEQGYKMKELAEYYGIPVTRMKNIVKQAGLRIKSNRGETVVLVDDTNEIEDLAKVSVEEYNEQYYWEQEELKKREIELQNNQENFYN